MSVRMSNSRFVIFFEFWLAESGNGLREELLRVHLGEVVDLVLRQELAEVVRLK